MFRSPGDLVLNSVMKVIVTKNRSDIPKLIFSVPVEQHEHDYHKKEQPSLNEFIPGKMNVKKTSIVK